MTLLDLLIKIFFKRNVIIKNLIILILFNLISILYIFYSHDPVKTKTIIFKDVPINAVNEIYQNFDMRELVKEGLSISIERDEFGFQSWDHKFQIIGDQVNQDKIDTISNVLFRSIIDHKIFILSTINKDPRNKYILNNINEYVQSNKIKKFFLSEDQNKKEQNQKMLSIIIQSNIFAIIIIFIFRVRLISKKL
ncbi:hypothetical protein N9U63_02150 [Candidatus Pelagibacter sp.]|nr:hypothetical protein [Candidatus Pelagibacter sp.]